MQEAAKRNGQKPLRISIEALSLFTAYSWPGNVRELQNAIQYAVVKCRGNIILPEHIPFEIGYRNQPERQQNNSGKINDYIVKSTLETTGGNKARAAKLLGVSRATLYRYFKKNV